MKSKRIYPAFTISKKGEMSLKNGHPWVYCDELRNEPEGLENGELCDVFSEKGSYLGTGFLSLTKNKPASRKIVPHNSFSVIYGIADTSAEKVFREIFVCVVR